MVDVVVGVDGSAQSLHALRTAAREARCRSARLDVVLVYEPQRARQADAAAAVLAGGMWPVADPQPGRDLLARAYRNDEDDRAEEQRHATGRLRQMLAQAADDLRGIEVTQRVIGDHHPAAALLRLSVGAGLLVVGSRGRGGFAGLLLGSVSQQLVQHAGCPVLVVRPSAPAASAAG